MIAAGCGMKRPVTLRDCVRAALELHYYSGSRRAQKATRDRRRMCSTRDAIGAAASTPHPLPPSARCRRAAMQPPPPPLNGLRLLRRRRATPHPQHTPQRHGTAAGGGAGQSARAAPHSRIFESGADAAVNNCDKRENEFKKLGG